jgi:hypothetical protein
MVIVRPGELIVYGALNIDIAAVALPKLRNCLTFITPFLSECFPCFPWLVSSLPQWRKPMDLNIRIISAHDFLKTTPTFQVDLETSKQFFLKLAWENAAPRQYDLLIDVRRTTGHLSLPDVIEVVKVVIEHPDSFQSKIAILTAPGVKLENAQFAALYANNRGFQMAAFTDFEETINWLMTSSEAPPAGGAS